MFINDSIRTPLGCLDYFSLLVADEKHLPLMEALASIAQIAEPDLTIFSIDHELDHLAQRIKSRIPADASVLQKIWFLNHFLYEELRLRGIANAKESPDFSCIHKVLKDRIGTDYLLAAIYLEFASCLQLKAKGILFPGRFLVKISFHRNNNLPTDIIIDPQTGLSLNMNNLQNLLEPYKQSHGLVDEFDIPTDLFLESATKKELLAGVLTHLRDAYLEEEDWPHLTQALDYLIALYPRHFENYRERGFALMRLGFKHKAASDFEYYLQNIPSQSKHDADYVAQQLESLRDAF